MDNVFQAFARSIGRCFGHLLLFTLMLSFLPYLALNHLEDLWGVHSAHPSHLLAASRVSWHRNPCVCLSFGSRVLQAEGGNWVVVSECSYKACRYLAKFWEYSGTDVLSLSRR